MTTFDEFTSLVAPPTDAWMYDWESCEATLGTRLPSDYKQLAETYGFGSFYSELGVWVPAHDGVPEYGNIESQGLWARSALRQIIPTVPPGTLWVHPDGHTTPVELVDADADRFLGWGNADGTYGFWHMVGDDPDQWPAVLTDLSAEWDYDPGGMLAYLLAKFTGTFPENTAPYDYEEPHFDRWTG